MVMTKMDTCHLAGMTKGEIELSTAHHRDEHGSHRKTLTFALSVLSKGNMLW